MRPSEKEMELARKYRNREFTEVQFNYLLVQNGIEKSKMEALLESLAYHEPMTMVAKMILIYMMVHFASCLFYSFLMLG